MPKYNKNHTKIKSDRLLDNPDISAVYNIWQESTEAVEMAKECLDTYPQLKTLADGSVYNNLKIMFTHQYLAARTW